MLVVGGAPLVQFESTKSWGVAPASANGTVVGNPGLQVGSYVSVNFLGVIFVGIVSDIRVSRQKNGEHYRFTLLDNRVRLGWGVVFGAWNMASPHHGEANRNVPISDTGQYSSDADADGADDVLFGGPGPTLDADASLTGEKSGESTGEERRRYWHILPSNWAKQIRTWTDEPLTAREILNSGISGAWSDYGFARTYHSSQSQHPVIGVDAITGKSLSAFISEVTQACGLDLYLQGSRNLVWDRKGEQAFQAPAPPVNGQPGGCMESLGNAIATWPTKVQVVGDPILVQVPGIDLEPDWAPGWQDFISELHWIREVGRVWDLTGDSPQQVAERNALAREVTVLEYIKESGAAPSEFADRRSWGKLSRMDIPAWVYINEIVFRSYRIPADYEFEGIPLSSLEIQQGLLAAMDEAEDGMAYRSEPAEFYPSSKAYVAAQGQPLDLVDLRSYDQFIDIRTTDENTTWQAINHFEIDGWHHSIRFDHPVFRDPPPESGGSMFLRPNRGEGGYGDRSADLAGTDYLNLRVANPAFSPEPAKVKACFVFRAGRWGEVYGSGPRATSYYASNLTQHLLKDASGVSDGVASVSGGPFGSSALKEVLYTGDVSAESVSESIAGALVSRDGVVEAGTYKTVGMAGAGLGPAVDRVTTTVSREGVVEVVDLVRERGSQVFIEPFEINNRLRNGELFAGQERLREEISRIRDLGELMSRDRNRAQGGNAVRTFSDSLEKAVGDQELTPYRIEDPAQVGPDNGGGPWKAGHVIWLGADGKPDAEASRLGGVVMAQSDRGAGGYTVNAAVRGVVPTLVKGPFRGGELVGCDPGESAARVGGEKPVGRINHDQGYEGEEVVMVAVSISAAREEKCRQFAPKLVGVGPDTKIGICPGWVVYHEPQGGRAHDGMTTARNLMPNIGGVLLDADPAPGVVLGEGPQSAWLLVKRYEAEIIFANTSFLGLDFENERVIKLADFEVVHNSDGEISGIKEVRQYLQGPYAYWAQGAACFEVMAWTENADMEGGGTGGGHMAVMLGGDFFDAGNGREGVVSLFGAPSYLSSPFAVQPGEKLIASWDTDHEGKLISEINIELKDQIGAMTVHHPGCADAPAVDGHYEKTVAEFELIDGKIGLTQRHTGTFWIWPDRSCGEEFSSSGSGPYDPSGSGSEPSSSSSGKTAVLPVAWADTGYAKLWATESGDCRFTETFTIELHGRVNRYRVDPRYVSVCEEETIQVMTVFSQDRPVRLAADYRGGILTVRQGYLLRGARIAVVHLTAIRKDFLGRKYEWAAVRDYIRNERCLNLDFRNDGSIKLPRIKDHRGGSGEFRGEVVWGREVSEDDIVKPL